MAAREEKTKPVLVWFRNDLRLADQAALSAAAAGGSPVVPVFVLEDEDAGAWAWGGASRWWLHGSLEALGAGLKRLGAPLVLRRGKAAEVLPALMREAGAETIHAGRAFEPWMRETEAAVAKAVPDGALRLHRTRTLFDLDEIKTGGGTAYGIYGPYARRLRERGAPDDALPAPTKLHGMPKLRSDALGDWGLRPPNPDWAGGLREAWTPGEADARARLERFVRDDLSGYATNRNDLGEPGTSTLSPSLHWGEIAPAAAWRAALEVGGEGADSFIGELLWREFAAYTLWHRPELPEEPLRPAMARLPHRAAPKELRAWQRGRTGVPIVDAGMRQLWHLGWMHNRARLITASFLVKHLLIRWQEGERWFWDTLIDADLANNGTNWQWVAGTGIDNQPFFRVFSPLSQAERFDGSGAYVRRWVPELAHLPDRYIHQPWAAPASALGRLKLGTDYPKPIVDLAEGRKRALAALRDIREAAG